jgi:hypothetical protein
MKLAYFGSCGPCCYIPVVNGRIPIMYYCLSAHNVHGTQVSIRPFCRESPIDVVHCPIKHPLEHRICKSLSYEVTPRQRAAIVPSCRILRKQLTQAVLNCKSGEAFAILIPNQEFQLQSAKRLPSGQMYRASTKRCTR